MGTRNLTMVLKDGEMKIAQYGQWDGYPSGNGLVVLEFLKSTNLEYFAEKLNSVKWIDEETHKRLWVEAGAAPDSEFVSMEISEEFKKRNPQLSRDAGADILNIVLKSEGELLLKNSTTFAKDGLFCEWAYLINMDENTLEVYTGFNKTPLTPEDRFYYNGYTSDGYTPIKMIKKYDINNLPDSDTFVKELEPEDDE